MVRSLHIIGAGGHAKTVIAVAVACGYNDLHIFDDDASKQGEEIMGWPVCGLISDSKGRVPLISAIGDNHLRAHIADMFHDREWTTLVHPSSIVDDSVFIGRGTLVAPMAVINPDSRIESQAIINTGAIIEHDCRIGHYVHVAPNATLTGGVEVGDFSLIGAGATIMPGRVVVGNAVVGAASLVKDHVLEGQVVAGVPARLLNAEGDKTDA